MKKILNLKEVADDIEISDGYHTFTELYEHRITIYIALCRILSEIIDPLGNPLTHIWRSQLHSDGSNFDGWFILGIGKEKGEQITYHLPNERWNETGFAKTLEKAPDFDGHSSSDVLKRIKVLSTTTPLSSSEGDKKEK